MTVEDKLFGTTVYGSKIFAFTIKNSNGLEMTLITYGATLQSFKIPDKNGTIGEVTLGFDTMEGYEGSHPYFGATIGRVANRIKGGRFILNGSTYKLGCNDGSNHIHGGFEGFSRKIWDAYPFVNGSTAGVKFFLESPDGDQGYPGKLNVTVTVSLDEENNLVFDYTAVTTKTTIINLTNHTYWNLSGAGKGSITGHILMLKSWGYLEVDDKLIPTGKIIQTKGTPFDFSMLKEIGDLEKIGGYDHCFVLEEGEEPDCILFSPDTGRGITVKTNSPGVQLYTGNFLGGLKERSGPLSRFDALCLEPQEFPDAVNHDNFPLVVLNPGETYSRNTSIHVDTGFMK